jgi:hypothetical protein
MKKLVLSAVALVAGAMLGYSQGTVTLANTSTSFFVSTNGSSLGLGTGNAWGGGGAQVGFDYEVLDMVDAADNPVSSLAANITNVFGSSSIFGQWTDASVTGSSENLVSKGGIVSGSTSAANWSTPGSSVPYGSNGQTPDYYLVIGWSVNEGNWNTVSNILAGNGTWAVTGAGSWFGVSAVGLNYAGGGTGTPSPASAVSLWNGSTGLANEQGLSPFQLTPIAPVPEPASMALAGLGGLSMLLIRRRKA